MAEDEIKDGKNHRPLGEDHIVLRKKSSYSEMAEDEIKDEKNRPLDEDEIALLKKSKSNKASYSEMAEDEIKDEKNPRPLDEDHIALLKTYVKQGYFSSFLHMETLCHGDSFDVIKCKSTVDGCTYAIKSVTFEHQNETKVYSSLREANILSDINDPNVVRYYSSWTESFIDQNTEDLRYKLYIQSEFCNLTLDRCDSGSLKKAVLSKYLTQIAAALAYIHKNDVLHLGLSSRAICIDTCDNAKLSNFRFALGCPGDKVFTSGFGDLYTYAPEVYTSFDPSTNSICVNKSTDIYSFGLVILDVLSNFSNETERKKCFELVRKGEFDFRDFDPTFRHVARRSLFVEPSLRFSAEKLWEFCETNLPRD